MELFHWFPCVFLACLVCRAVSFYDADIEQRHNPDNYLISDPAQGFSAKAFATFEREVEDAIHRLDKEDKMFYESGVDFHGGNSAIAMHAMIINTRPKSVELGRLERNRIYAIHSFSKTKPFANFNRSAIIDTLTGIFEQVNSSYRGLFTNSGKCPGEEDVTCNPKSKFRTIDGSCNNLKNPRWGKSFIPMRRFEPPEYDDGVSTPRTLAKDGSPLPNVRLVSRMLHSSDVNHEVSSKITHMLMQWGQFLDHDLTSTPMHQGINQTTARCCLDDISSGLSPDVVNALLTRDICFAISIPPNDETFYNRTCINFVRSIQVANSDCEFEPVEQLNQVTAFIDASQVYGSSKEEEDRLRFHKAGFLKFHSDGLLPQSHEFNCIPQDFVRDYCFDAGDERVNEHTGLTSMHTVWMREHNRISRQLGIINPHWNDERLFQETRKIIGAMMQKITYDEFLPTLLNQRIRRFFNLESGRWGYNDVYNDKVDASIRNVFATSAFRLGHTLIRSTFSKLESAYTLSGADSLSAMFGNTTKIINTKGKAVTAFMGGMTRDHAHKFDRFMTPEVTQKLFLDRNGNSLDLASLNLQRGRDHGLPGYNAWRKWCNMPVANHFGTGPGGLIDHPPDAAEILGQLYTHPDDIDPFAGMMSENLLPGSVVGPTVGCLIAATFKFVKEGDRFWYENSHDPVAFSVAQLHAIKSVSLARVICDNTDMAFMQPWVMQVPDYVSNPIVRCSDLQSIDLSYWKEITPFWSAWTYWSKCDGNGFQRRYRSCSNDHGGCVGPNAQKRPCNSYGASTEASFGAHPEASHGGLSLEVWTSWSSWTPCINNRKRRYRICIRDFSQVHTCKGESFQALKCQKQKFCPFPDYSAAQQACLKTISKVKQFG